MGLKTDAYNGKFKRKYTLSWFYFPTYLHKELCPYAKMLNIVDEFKVFCYLLRALDPVQG